MSSLDVASLFMILMLTFIALPEFMPRWYRQNALQGSRRGIALALAQGREILPLAALGSLNSLGVPEIPKKHKTSSEALGPLRWQQLPARVHICSISHTTFRTLDNC